jgi:hypothetical protein
VGTKAHAKLRHEDGGRKRDLRAAATDDARGREVGPMLDGETK